MILDEPTNHMDIVGKESLEAMLKAYPGSVLFVSHDRYFVKEIADSLLVFENGTVNFYPFGYEQYWEKLQADEKERQDQQADGKPGKLQPVGKNIGVSAKDRSPEKAKNSSPEKAGDAPAAAAPEPLKNAADRKGYNPGKEEAKRKRRLERLEMLIAQKEEELAAYQAQLKEPSIQSDYEKLMELEALCTAADEQLEALMMEWEESGCY